MSIVHTGLLILAVTLVAIADIFLKEASIHGNIGKTLLSPWVMGAVLLYLIQIFIFIYLFTTGAKLSYVGVMQVVFYAVIVLLASFLIFKESLTLTQIIGIILALSGVVLLNL